MGVNGIYGLSGSGIDVESMVKVGMLSKQKQYDKMQQNYTKNEWTKQAYNEVYNKLTTFSTSTLSPYKMSSNMSAKSAVSSNSDAVTATANGNAVIMNHKVQVNALATSAYLVATESLKGINEEYENGSVQLQDYIFKKSTYNAVSNTLNVVGSSTPIVEDEDPAILVNSNGDPVGINDTAFEFWISDGTTDAKGNENKVQFKYTYGELLGLKLNARGTITETDNAKTFNDFVSDFNAKGTNIRASYDAVGGKFSFYNKEGGADNKIQLTLTSGDVADNTATFFQGMKLAQSSDGTLYGMNNAAFDSDQNYIGANSANITSSAQITAGQDEDGNEIIASTGTAISELSEDFDFANFNMSINGTSITATLSKTSTSPIEYGEADEDGNQAVANSATKLNDLADGVDLNEDFSLLINGTEIRAAASQTSTSPIEYGEEDDDGNQSIANADTKLGDLGYEFGDNFDLSINGTRILATPTMTSSSAVMLDGSETTATAKSYLKAVVSSTFDMSTFDLSINGTQILSTPSMTSTDKITYDKDDGSERTARLDTSLNKLFSDATGDLVFTINGDEISFDYSDEITEEDADGNPVTVQEAGFFYKDANGNTKEYTLGDLINRINDSTEDITASFSAGKLHLKSNEPSLSPAITIAGDSAELITEVLHLTQNDDITLGDLVDMINAESDTTNVVASFNDGKFSLTSTDSSISSQIELGGTSAEALTSALNLENDDVTLGDLVDMINAQSGTTKVFASIGDDGRFNLTSTNGNLEIVGNDATEAFLNNVLQLDDTDLTLGNLVNLINAESDTTGVVASLNDSTGILNLTSSNGNLNVTSENSEIASFLSDTLHLADDAVTIDNLIGFINAESDTTNVFASFNDGKFSLASTVGGSNSTINIEANSDTMSLLTGVLKFAETAEDDDSDSTSGTGAVTIDDTSITVTASSNDGLVFGASGTNGSATVDGVEFNDLTSNSVTAYGVTYKLHNVTESTVNVNIEQDVDAIVEKVKSFVEDYNTLLGGLYDKYNEKKYSDYSPLTTSQKETMKDEQIEKWEEKAKSGLLYHDQTISKIVTKMRNAISNPIDGITGNYTSAYSIGISTTGMYGQLTLDEDKLRAALNNDSESVYNVISTLSEDDDFDQNGLAQRLGDVMVEATKLIKDRAGTDDSINDDSDLGSLMRELQNKMSDFKKLLDAFEERLYKKYDAMEVALATLGTQLSYITGNQ